MPANTTTSLSIKSAELKLTDRYSCCFSNVATWTFFFGICGFSISLFFCLAMILAHFNYNIIPAACGIFNYSLLIIAEFSRRPSLYQAFMWINILGIVFYTVISCFLIIMLFTMPNWFVTLMRHHVIERGSFAFSIQVVQMMTILNLGFYVIGVLLSLYVTYIVRKTYKFTMELREYE